MTNKTIAKRLATIKAKMEATGLTKNNVIVGITDYGDDPAFNDSWIETAEEADCKIVILVSKGMPTKKGRDWMIKHKDMVIFHATTTGWGDTELEPGVKPFAKRFDALDKLVDKGFPKDRIWIRVDPIFLTKEGVTRACIVMQEAYDRGYKEIKYSFVDTFYKHVQARFEVLGLELPPASILEVAAQEPLKIINQKIRELEEQGMHFTSCAEGAMHHEGCICPRIFEICGLDPNLCVGNAGQRKACGCSGNKLELFVGGNSMKCGHMCAYCYCKDTALDRKLGLIGYDKLDPETQKTLVQRCKENYNKKKSNTTSKKQIQKVLSNADNITKILQFWDRREEIFRVSGEGFVADGHGPALDFRMKDMFLSINNSLPKRFDPYRIGVTYVGNFLLLCAESVGKITILCNVFSHFKWAAKEIAQTFGPETTWGQIKELKKSKDERMSKRILKLFNDCEIFGAQFCNGGKDKYVSPLLRTFRTDIGMDYLEISFEQTFEVMNMIRSLNFLSLSLGDWIAAFSDAEEGVKRLSQENTIDLTKHFIPNFSVAAKEYLKIIKCFSREDWKIIINWTEQNSEEVFINSDGSIIIQKIPAGIVDKTEFGDSVFQMGAMGVKTVEIDGQVFKKIFLSDEYHTSIESVWAVLREFAEAAFEEETPKFDANIVSEINQTVARRPEEYRLIKLLKEYRTNFAIGILQKERMLIEKFGPNAIEVPEGKKAIRAYKKEVFDTITLNIRYLTRHISSRERVLLALAASGVVGEYADIKWREISNFASSLAEEWFLFLNETLENVPHETRDKIEFKFSLDEEALLPLEGKQYYFKDGFMVATNGVILGNIESNYTGVMTVKIIDGIAYATKPFTEIIKVPEIEPPMTLIQVTKNDRMENVKEALEETNCVYTISMDNRLVVYYPENKTFMTIGNYRTAVTVNNISSNAKIYQRYVGNVKWEISEVLMTKEEGSKDTILLLVKNVGQDKDNLSKDALNRIYDDIGEKDPTKEASKKQKQ